MPQTAELQSDMPQECRIIPKISLPQGGRVLHTTMQPLHSDRLHPLRRILDAAGVKIVSRADAKHERGIEQMQVAMHETLLLGRAYADPDDVRLQLAYAGDEGLFLFSVEITKGRSVR